MEPAPLSHVTDRFLSPNRYSLLSEIHHSVTAFFNLFIYSFHFPPPWCTILIVMTMGITRKDSNSHPCAVVSARRHHRPISHRGQGCLLESTEGHANFQS